MSPSPSGKIATLVIDAYVKHAKLLAMRLLAAVLALFCATPAAALELFLRDSLDIDVSSLAFDPVTCTLWLADESSVVRHLTLRGELIQDVQTELSGVKTLTVLDQDTLLISNGWGQFQHLTMGGKTSGAQFRLAEGLYDTEGLHREPDGTLLIAEDDTARVMRFTAQGEQLMSVNGFALDPPMVEPQGVTRDPLSGNILVVDDNEGLNAIFEFTGDGSTLLSVTPLSAYGRDAEAITLSPLTGTLFVGFDSGRKLAIFDYLPTRSSNMPALPTGPDCASS